MSTNPDLETSVLSPLRPVLAAAYELFMLLPIWLLALHSPYLNAEIANKWAAAGVLLSLIGAASSPRVRMLWKRIAIGMLAAAGAGGLLIHAYGSSFGAYTGCLLLFAAAMLGFTVANRYRRQGWYWTAVGVYFLASAILHFVPEWKGDASFLTFGGFVCLAIALFAVNGLHLHGVTLSENDRGRVPSDLKRHNRRFLVAMLVLLALLPAGAGGWLFRLLRGAIRGFFAILAALLPKGEPQPTPPPETEAPPPQMEMPPTKEPGWFLRLLDHVLPYFVLAALAALLIWGIYRLYRDHKGFLRRWLEGMARWLRRPGREAESPGFTDEQSSLFSWEETLGRLRKSRIGRLLKANREPGWKDLTRNRDRIRYLYRKWLREQTAGGYPASPHLTPRETALEVENLRRPERHSRLSRGDKAEWDEARLIDTYYKARYAEEEPTDEELKAVRGTYRG
ncbi:DUF4129 domain-containing protein [Cohnella candidum]|uniref:DUF4129 domain-containing protein n=1 Tax=Cohnella candidum TaxID=2674991 RepID=A0A3G3JZ44_9BACL|nr:DUF4129 domain-containing protein [Cohnella candidum]AYQ73526.1 DUF4129 domain-containing protein [Cohnella candidum]